jgi:hypothetical protein
MFLRQIRRKKDGKTHVYWNIVDNRRLDDGRVVQRQVLYLGEIHSSQAAVWPNFRSFVLSIVDHQWLVGHFEI